MIRIYAYTSVRYIFVRTTFAYVMVMFEHWIERWKRVYVTKQHQSSTTQWNVCVCFTQFSCEFSLFVIGFDTPLRPMLNNIYIYFSFKMAIYVVFIPCVYPISSLLKELCVVFGSIVSCRSCQAAWASIVMTHSWLIDGSEWMCNYAFR